MLRLKQPNLSHPNESAPHCRGREGGREGERERCRCFVYCREEEYLCSEVHDADREDEVWLTCSTMQVGL